MISSIPNINSHVLSLELQSKNVSITSKYVCSKQHELYFNLISFRENMLLFHSKITVKVMFKRHIPLCIVAWGVRLHNKCILNYSQLRLFFFSPLLFYLIFLHPGWMLCHTVEIGSLHIELLTLWTISGSSDDEVMALEISDSLTHRLEVIGGPAVDVFWDHTWNTLLSGLRWWENQKKSEKISGRELSNYSCSSLGTICRCLKVFKQSETMEISNNHSVIPKETQQMLDSSSQMPKGTKTLIFWEIRCGMMKLRWSNATSKEIC